MVWQSNTLGPQHLQHQPSIFTPPGVLKAKPNPSHLWTGGSPQVAPTGDWRSTLPSGNQTWLAQKTPINCVKIVYEWKVDFPAMHCLTTTHLLRNILSNYWCGMHRTCKNTSFKPDRKWWMTRGEKQCRGKLSTSLLDATVSSDEVGRNSGCENRTGTDMKLKDSGLVLSDLKKRKSTWRF